jgi:hypothetical protein
LLGCSSVVILMQPDRIKVSSKVSMMGISCRFLSWTG